MYRKSGLDRCLHLQVDEAGAPAAVGWMPLPSVRRGSCRCRTDTPPQPPASGRSAPRRRCRPGSRFRGGLAWISSTRRAAASAPPTALVPLCCVRGPPTRVAHPAGRVAHPKDALRDACELLSLQIRLEAKDLRPPGGNLSRFCPSADLGQPRLGDPHLLPGLQHCILQAIVGIQNGDHLTCLNAIARCPQSILYSVGDL